ncbi:fumarate hydratase [Hufsiella ginkgonis]|uniref:Fumarate hydratase n=1 Tax=Hufsiella ginkgonis TaxID=2695274 RepID=A0A7K1XUC3_9SPHI|nr:fumarate hydratase [Hufsiella ginkgonis]MXV14613.1 fumarate hydratase [Hufsiella ginkgonis]
MRFTGKVVFFGCFLFLGITACKFNPNVRGKGTAYLQGVWTEEKAAYQDQLLQYTRHTFTFTCDSFYAVLKTTARVNPYPDSCFSNGSWTEYAKGKYLVRNDTLYINATFTHASFKQKLSGCYRIGQYLQAFLIKKHSADTLRLLNMQHVPITMDLKEKIVCH